MDAMFPPGWLHKDVQRAAKRVALWRMQDAKWEVAKDEAALRRAQDQLNKAASEYASFA